MSAIFRLIRGIRDSIPSGYIIGRTASGVGRPHLIKLSTLVQDPSNGVLPGRSGSAGLSPNLTSGHIFVGNASGSAADVAASGDLTNDNTGKFTINGSRGLTATAWVRGAASGSGAAYSDTMQGEGTTGVRMILSQALASASVTGAPGLQMQRSTGSLGSPAVIAAGALVFALTGEGFGATAFQRAVSLRGAVLATETPSDTAMGGQWIFEASPLGSATLSNLGTWDWTSGFSVETQISHNKQRVTTYASGASLTISNGVDFVSMLVNATRATGTIILPAAPTDGQEVAITGELTITALTFQANSGQTLLGTAPTSLTPLTPIRYVYDATSATWAPAAVSGSGSIPTGANPSATASDTVVNGSATTFMTSDSAPAVQKASATQFGIVKVDGTTVVATGGVIAAPGGSGTSAKQSAGFTSSGNGTIGSAAFATEGYVFLPSQSLLISEIEAYVKPGLTGATYVMSLVTVTQTAGSYTITSQAAVSGTITTSGTTTQKITWTPGSPLVLSAGSYYALLITGTSLASGITAIPTLAGITVGSVWNNVPLSLIPNSSVTNFNRVILVEIASNTAPTSGLMTTNPANYIAMGMTFTF